MKKIIVSLLVIGFATITLASCGPSAPRPRLPRRLSEIEHAINLAKADPPIMVTTSNRGLAKF